MKLPEPHQVMTTAGYRPGAPPPGPFAGPDIEPTSAVRPTARPVAVRGWTSTHTASRALTAPSPPVQTAARRRSLSNSPSRRLIGVYGNGLRPSPKGKVTCQSDGGGGGGGGGGGHLHLGG